MGLFISLLIDDGVESIVALFAFHGSSDALAPALFSFLQPLISILDSLHIWMVTVDFQTAGIISEANILLFLDILVLIFDNN